MSTTTWTIRFQENSLSLTQTAPRVSSEDSDSRTAPLTLTTASAVPPDLSLLKSRTKAIALAARGDPLSLKQIRVKLAEERHALSAEEWSEVKGEVREVAERVLVSLLLLSAEGVEGRAGADSLGSLGSRQESSPEKVPPKKTKYDRVASKNLDVRPPSLSPLLPTNPPSRRLSCT